MFYIMCLFQCGLDPVPLAHSHVYFEKLVMMVSKFNLYDYIISYNYREKLTSHHVSF